MFSIPDPRPLPAGTAVPGASCLSAPVAIAACPAGRGWVAGTFASLGFLNMQRQHYLDNTKTNETSRDFD